MLTPNFARQKSMLAKFARSIRKNILMVEYLNRGSGGVDQDISTLPVGAFIMEGPSSSVATCKSPLDAT